MKESDSKEKDGRKTVFGAHTNLNKVEERGVGKSRP